MLYTYHDENVPRVIEPRILGELNYMMSRVVTNGTGRHANFGWPAGGKTGTSQDFRDAWFVGYTTNLTTGVWFGNDDGSPTNRVTGGSLPAEAWKQFMVAAHKGVPKAPLPGTSDWQGAAVASGGNWPPPGTEVATGATHPVPDADVGSQAAAPRPRHTTLLDLILGRSN